MSEIGIENDPLGKAGHVRGIGKVRCGQYAAVTLVIQAAVGGGQIREAELLTRIEVPAVGEKIVAQGTAVFGSMSDLLETDSGRDNVATRPFL